MLEEGGLEAGKQKLRASVSQKSLIVKSCRRSHFVYRYVLTHVNVTHVEPVLNVTYHLRHRYGYCTFVRPRVPCVSRLPPVSFYRPLAALRSCDAPLRAFGPRSYRLLPVRRYPTAKCQSCATDD